MTTIAILGSNSFSASHFIDFLLTNTDYHVIGISRSQEKQEMYLPYKKNKNIRRFRFYQYDLNKAMPQILGLLDREKPEVIVHFASLCEVATSWKHPEHYFATNVMSLISLVQHLRNAPYLKKYVQISSPEVYGSCEGKVTEDAPYNPSTPYAVSKAAQDMLLQAMHKHAGFPVVFVRSTNVYGPGHQLYRIFPRTVISVKMGKKIPLHGGGKAVKSFVHIRDACDGYLKIIQKGKIGEIYHLSPTSGCTIRSIVERICARMGEDFLKCTENVDERLGQDKAYIIDSTKARDELGWKPVIALDEGVNEIIEWVEQNWEMIKNEPLDYIHQP